MYFKDLLRYRKVWMGIAIVWIVLFHSQIDCHFAILNSVRQIGYGGVDIFFFASGIGCYYSLSANPDIGSFMKRRIKRLFPTYLLFIVLWLGLKCLISEFGFQMALGNILAIQNFTGLKNDFNWYISAIWLFYLLAPYFKIIIDRASFLGRCFFLLLLIVFSVPFWTSDTYLITVIRMPIFYIGMLFATSCQQCKKIRPVHVAVAGVLLSVGTLILVLSKIYLEDYLRSHGMYWYPFIFITPPLCMGISWIMIILEKTKLSKYLVQLLSLFGEYSFEIYLIHIPLIGAINMLLEKFNLYNIAGIVWVLGLVVLAVGCFVLRRTVNLCGRLLLKIKQR